MRKALLALVLGCTAPLALAVASGAAVAEAALLPAKSIEAPNAVTRVDYYRRHHYRPYRSYYRGPSAYGYYPQRAYYGAPAYYAPPVAYYPPPVVVYYPPPVVVYPRAPAAYYGDYADW